MSWQLSNLIQTDTQCLMPVYLQAKALSSSPAAPELSDTIPQEDLLKYYSAGDLAKVVKYKAEAAL